MKPLHEAEGLREVDEALKSMFLLSSATTPHAGTSETSGRETTISGGGHTSLWTEIPDKAVATPGQRLSSLA